MDRKEAVTILQEKRDLARMLEAAEKSADWAAKDRVDSSSLRASQHGRYADALDMAISALSPPNEPLTIEQLREMDGEPVYIIAKDMGIAEWNVITGKEPIAIAYDCPMPGFKSVVEGIAFANGRAFRAGAYGITWLAYRRPPEGEANA